ncbi:hypothetical protein BCR34DRAFT_572302 [Clohesyomyces aquaticus]|uniref:PNPLA domain-containing protein n=1 Tax=Clohesyomyces aquaticus TaxID=1231657 RepID=A0A1Y1Z473_9PLEO|nr:hypothetical protein BCR34DRAFT_572302 [Clohesyomyces aquaticus]
MLEGEVSDHISCEDCGDETFRLFRCNICQYTLCDKCWDRQLVHKKVAHEKTDLRLACRIDAVFSKSQNAKALESLHDADEATAWFGIDRDVDDDQPPTLRVSRRYSDIFQMRHRMQSGKFPQSPESDKDMQEKIPVPSLVSFVGQTGAGKSTIVDLLIQGQTGSGSIADYCSPVPGSNSEDLPTSEDIHLYVDPSTIESHHCILYADCEGLDAGEREPFATALRKDRQRKPKKQSEAPSETFSNDSHKSLEREISWMKSKTKRSRQFAAGQLYPRILFSFSDVVVFVHRNSRAVEVVLERLLEWGSVAVETTNNQPILPYAIIVINATKFDTQPSLWDVETSTKLFFESFAETVDKNAEFCRHAELWRKRGKSIVTLESLMLCYFSSIRVLRIPTNSRPQLLNEQTEKLYAEIRRGSQIGLNQRADLRMSLDIFEFQAYLNHAFDHFCETIELPFDFVRSTLLHTHLSTTFADGILALAIYMIPENPRKSALAIFEKLSPLIASSIMLDTTRSNLKGTPDRIFAQYISHIDSALREFCNRHWPCEYFVRDRIPPHLQAHMNTMDFQRDVRSTSILLRCVNVRSGHAAKGHQLHDGRIFARGAYLSSFSVKENRKQVLDQIYSHFCNLLVKSTQLIQQGTQPLDAASTIHRDDVLATRYPPTDMKDRSLWLKYTSFCICCLLNAPETTLPCGHMLCRHCVMAFGRERGRMIVEVLECPLETNSYIRCQPRSVYLKPVAAGVRVLALEDGGIRSIIQVEVLKLIERELRGKLPMQCFFDMIVGKGTGGALALGIVTQGWTLQACSENLCSLFRTVYAPENARKLPSVSIRQLKVYHPRYISRTLDECLKGLYSPDRKILDSCHTNHPVDQSTKLVILASSAEPSTVVFSNYRRKEARARKLSSTVPYILYPDHIDRGGPNTWEAARATMANVGLFKPFVDSHLGPLYQDSDVSSSNLVSIAEAECRAVYSCLQDEFPDLVLSLGCGRANDHDKPHATDPSQVAWDEYIQSLPGHFPRSSFIRINPLLDKLPDFGDVTSITKLQQSVGTLISPIQITDLAAQLFATLFYVESRTSSYNTNNNELIIPVRILCRLPNETAEIQEIARLFKQEQYRNAVFVFLEQGSTEEQTFSIPERSIDDMITHLWFQIPTYGLVLRQFNVVVYAMLRFENGNTYSLSGFPRVLGSSDVRSSTASTRRTALVDPPKQMRQTWTAPDPRDSVMKEASLGLPSQELSLARFPHQRPGSLAQSNKTPLVEMNAVPSLFELEAPNEELMEHGR